MNRWGWRWTGRQRAAVVAGLLGVVGLVAPVFGGQDGDGHGGLASGFRLIADEGPSLRMPILNSARGRILFAGKGCVICHSINGVGGEMGPRLDAAAQTPFANPLDFAARMWTGAEAMIALQDKELGYQIELDGDELADIVAFAHDGSEQRKFSESDVPEDVMSILRAIIRTQPL